MASKRLLKKKIRNMVFEVLNECDYVIVHGGGDADSADALMDEAVDFHDEVIGKINRAENKKDFKEIMSELNKVGLDFTKKLNALHK